MTTPMPTINHQLTEIYVMVDDKFDVRIVRTDEGLVVDIYPWDGNEAVASTYAFDSDVEGEEEAEAA